MLRSTLLATALCLLVSSGCKKDPSTPEYWEGRLQEAPHVADKLRVLDALDRSQKVSPAFLSMLHAHLAAEKSPQTRAAVARLLGEVKDPSSVDPLLSVLNLGEGHGPDGNALNREVVSALAAIGDPRAEEPLVRLLSSKDPFTRLQAMDAVGKLKSQKAVVPLTAIAQDPNSEPLLVRQAISALGDIRDPRSVPLLVQMLYEERQNVSFYPESAFALFQLGKPATDEVLGVLKGENLKVSQWAESKGVVEAALISKAAQVLGDMNDARAEAPLVQRLAYKNPDTAQTMVVRVTAANALGRMHSKEGAHALTGMLDQDIPLVRAEYARALALGGTDEAAGALAKAAAAGPWESREPVLAALSLTTKDPAVFEKLAKEEPAALAAECKKHPKDEACGKEQKETLLQQRQQTILAFVAPVKAADQCKADVGCWAQKLVDTDARVQRRAAIELGRSGKPEAVQPLAEHLSEKDPETRSYVIDAVTWLVDHSPEAARTIRSQLPNLERQLADEKGRTDYQRVNEDLRRLTAKVRQAA